MWEAVNLNKDNYHKYPTLSQFLMMREILLNVNIEEIYSFYISVKN